MTKGESPLEALGSIGGAVGIDKEYATAAGSEIDGNRPGGCCFAGTALSADGEICLNFI
jgi:hypothetical protein